jgi:putative transposase
MQISSSAYYDWLKRPGKLISAETLRLFRKMKELFEISRNSLGSREMMKKLREEGFQIGRHKTRKLMAKLGLKVTQRIAYKITTTRKHGDSVAEFVKPELQPNGTQRGLGG